MRILRIELVGFRWFGLSNFNKFVYSPKHKIQLLLGTNGSGKSSLMRELTPLPANQSDYKPGGSKTIVIEKDNQVYILKSHFKGSSPHSFMLGDEELNIGGTATVQRDLVRQYFGITPDIHEVMIGFNNFSDMSVAQRREWFTRMSNINFNFAIAIYKKLKDKLRDIESVLKFQNTTLVNELSKSIDEKELPVLLERLQQLKDLIDHILELKSNIPSNATALLSIQDMDRRLSVHTDTLFRELRSLFSHIAIDSFDILPSAIQNIEIDIAVLKKRYTAIGEEIEKRQSLIDSLEKVSEEEYKNLQSETDKITVEINELIGRLRILDTTREVSEFQSAIDLAYSSLEHIFYDMPHNEDRKYSKVKYQEIEHSLASLNNERQKLETDIALYERKITEYEHAKEHNTLTCPQCKYSWIRGHTEEDINKIKAILLVSKTRLAELIKTIEIASVYKAETIAYFEKYRSYQRVKEQLPILTRLWEVIDSEELVFKSPQTALNTINEARYDLPTLITIKQLREHSGDLQKLFSLTSRMQEADFIKQRQEYEALHNEYASIQSSIGKSQIKLARLKSMYSTYQSIKAMQTNIEANLAERNTQYEHRINTLRHQVLQDLLRTLQLEYNQKQDILTKHHLQHEIVEKLKAQIADLLIQKETLSVMISELSPKDGLIARSLSGFINNFVLKMNRIISQIWLYPFELLPIENNEEDSVDLDYKFEVRSNGNTESSDIKKCSSGQREVIDLAFKIVSMSYLGLSSAPIYLDEFGKSMDSSHRVQAFNTITQLIGNSNYSQVFVVSHYEGSYGGLKNADIVVLNPDNIVIPPGTIFNQVVEINS